MKSTTNKPTVFIGSSSEAIDVLNKLCVSMKRWSKPTKWCDIFTAGQVTIDSLLNKIPEYDLCVFIWFEDDDLVSRGNKYKVARDNVIFETGIAHGVMGRQKAFIVKVGDVKSISDLAGVTYINYRVGDSMNVVSNEIKKAFYEFDSHTQKEKVSEETTEKHSDVDIIDFNRAKIRRAQSGIGIIDELETHMLNSDREAFIEALGPLSTNNSAITENSFLKITSQCMRMQLPHYALEIIEFANRKFPKSDRVKIRLMDILMEVGLGDNECQVRAHNMMEEFFCIDKNNKNLPVFTEESKSKRVFEHDYDRLQTIFNVYLYEDDYEALLSLIDSCPVAGIDASDVFINGYKAHALAECGQTEAARAIYESILPENPNDRRLLQLADVLIDCNEKTKGYRLFELNAINYFDSKSLILLARKIHDIQICRTLSNGFINTEFNHNASKKVIVPLLFKAIEKSPFETTLREVKNMLVILGAREEYDFIKENEHMPYGVFSNLKAERLDAYTWDILDYIETENIAEKNVGDAAVKFKEKIFEILKEDSTTMNIEVD